MNLKERIRDEIFIAFLMGDMPWEILYDHLLEIGFPPGKQIKNTRVIDNSHRVETATLKRKDEYKCEWIADRMKYRSFHREGIYESTHMHKCYFIPMECLKDSLCSLWEYDIPNYNDPKNYDLKRWYR